MVDMTSGQIGYAVLSFGVLLGMGDKAAWRPSCRHKACVRAWRFSSA